MREKKKSILSIRVSNTKLPIRVKEKCEDFYYTKRMSSDGLGESDTSPGTGRVEPIVSIIENKQRASQHVTANGRRTTRTGSEDFVDLHGFTASVSKQSMETVELLFCVCFCFVLFCFPPH